MNDFNLETGLAIFLALPVIGFVIGLPSLAADRIDVWIRGPR